MMIYQESQERNESYSKVKSPHRPQTDSDEVKREQDDWETLIELGILSRTMIHQESQKSSCRVTRIVSVVWLS